MSRSPDAWQSPSWALLGPGLVIAATGVGAGDMVAAAVAGAKYGYAVVWAAAVGALLKFVLNEGLARWQLATGTTLLEGWVQRLGRWAQWFFLAYLVAWSFVVGGALISACGLAGHAIAPGLSVEAWGALHSVVAVGLVLGGGYERFEGLMKLFVGVMFAALVGCALFVSPMVEAAGQVVRSVSLPPGSSAFVLGMIGGVGGSLTLLSYGYWIREKGWTGPGWRGMVRFDLGVAYALTGLFGVAVAVMAARVLHADGTVVEGPGGVVRMAEMLRGPLGEAGVWTFKLGFWAAVCTSMLGVWQSVPYMFCDFVGLSRRLGPEEQEAIIQTTSPWYRGYLLFLAFPPMLLLLWGKPVLLVVVYSVVGALFMPFLAGTLLYMNSRVEWVGELRSGPVTTILLVLGLVLFTVLVAVETVPEVLAKLR